MRFCLLLPILAVTAPASPLSGVWETGHFSLLPRSLQSDPELDILINTEFTAAGKQAQPASPDRPVYFTGADGGLVTVGELIAGERPAPASQLQKILTQALRQEGYVAAQPGHSPSIFIRYHWGSFNQLEPLPGPPDVLDRLNLLERAALVGGSDFANRMAEAMVAGTLGLFEDSSPRINFLVEEAHADRYFIIASAYDYAAMRQHRRVLLWSTRISTNSRGVMMDESLPQLVAAAVPYFGHPTDGPVRLNRPIDRTGHVTIGTPVVKEVLPPERSNP